MTKKRFTITQDFEEHHRQIRDNGHIIMGCFVEPQAETIVNLLNELHEENEQLKSDCDYRWKKYCNTRKEMLHEIEQLKNKYTDEYVLRETLQQELQRVEAENEQLKSKLECAEKVLGNIGYDLVYSEKEDRWVIE